MFESLFGYFSKPFVGLAIMVRLFAGAGTSVKEPTVESLKFVNTADSVFVQAVIRNGLTSEIKELMEGGVAVKTTCTFSCGTFSKQWVRELQFNPVKRSVYCRFPDGLCHGVFIWDSLAFYFNRIEFYCADVASARKMRSAPARLKISTSTKIDALAIGEKELWPKKIVADFNVPELPTIE